MITVEKLLIAIVVVVFLNPAYLRSTKYEVITHYEQKFDIPIKDVMLNLYQQENVLKFYPKIICFARCDSTQYGLTVAGIEEVRIFDLQGEVIRKLGCDIGDRDRFGYSRKGNYFYIYNSMPMEGEAQGDLGVLKVYNDYGELLWEKDSLLATIGISHRFHLSSKDGSAVIQTIMGYEVDVIENHFELYDSGGNMRKSELTAQQKYSNMFDFSDDLEYFGNIFYQFPEKKYTENPIILLMDSTGKVLWKRKLNVNVLDTSELGGHFISSQGTYVYAAGYNLNEINKRVGYLFNKQGNLIMEIAEGSMPIGFSDNEKYMLIKTLSSKISDRLDMYEPGNRTITLIDIENKKILFNKEVGLTGYPDTDYGDAAVIGPDGKVAFIEEIISKPSENRKGFQWKKVVKVIDKKGNEIYESDPLLSIGNGLVFGHMEWHGSNLVYLSLDETRRTLQLESVLFME